MLSRSFKLTALKYWTIAWLCLSFSLICLRLGYSFEVFSSLLFTYYYLGQYIFAFLLVAGCRSLDGNWELRSRSQFWIVPFLVLAIALPLLSKDLNEIYGLHTLILSGFFGAAFFAIRRSALRSFGWRVMHISLAALTLDFFLHSVVYTASIFVAFDTSFLTYNPIVELVLQTALGFGMVIVLLEKVLSEAKSAHERLQDTNEKLEELLHTDPLTAAFSRHAFYGFVKKRGEENSETSGCVGFFDIDDLKSINDRFGHGAGDLAIRCVVKAIRDIIRAEDLIFRWGGDEFFVIMVSMDADKALTRLTKLDAALTGLVVEGIPEPIDISVSWGFTDFDDISGLEEAINRADASMYSRKQERKKRSGTTRNFLPEFGNASPTLSV